MKVYGAKGEGERTNGPKGIEISVWPSTTVPGGVYVEIDTSYMDEATPLLVYMNDGQLWSGDAGGHEIEYPCSPGETEG